MMHNPVIPTSVINAHSNAASASASLTIPTDSAAIKAPVTMPMIEACHTERKRNAKCKKLIHQRLYSNEIIGKGSGQRLLVIDGCDWLTETQCERKKALKGDIRSGELFRVIKEQTAATEWMGTEFAELSLNWKQHWKEASDKRIGR